MSMEGDDCLRIRQERLDEYTTRWSIILAEGAEFNPTPELYEGLAAKLIAAAKAMRR